MIDLMKFRRLTPVVSPEAAFNSTMPQDVTVRRLGMPGRGAELLEQYGTQPTGPEFRPVQLDQPSEPAPQLRRLPMPEEIRQPDASPRLLRPVQLEQSGSDYPQRRLPMPEEIGLPDTIPTQATGTRGAEMLRRLTESPPTEEAQPRRLRPVQLEDTAQTQEVRRLISPGTRMPAAPDHSHDKPRGFLGNVKHRLEHIGKGLIMGLADGGLGGAAAGAITGGVSPETVDRAIHRRVTIPQWQMDEEFAAEQADGQIDRARALAGMTGYDQWGNATPTQQRILELGERNDTLERQGEEKALQAWERIEQAETKQQAAERNTRIKNILASARIPGRRFDQATKDELQQTLGVTLPDDFDPMKHDLVQDRDGNYQVVSISQATGQQTLRPVVRGDGQPLQGKLPSQGNQPAWVYRGQAERELLKEGGYSSPSQLVANPAFESLVEEAKRNDAAAAQQYGRPPASDAEIRRDVAERNKSVKQRVRAGELVKDRVNQRASEMWEKRQGKTGSARPASPTTGASKASREALRKSDSAKIDAAIKEIDDSGLSPTQKEAAKKKLRDAQNRRLTSEVLEAPEGELLRASYQQSGDDDYALRPSADGKEFESTITVPKAWRNDRAINEALTSAFKREFLVRLGWNEKTFDRWKRANGDRLPVIKLKAGKLDNQGRVVIRAPADQVQRFTKYALRDAEGGVLT